MGTTVFLGRLCSIPWKIAKQQTYPRKPPHPRKRLKMFSRIVKLMLAIVNRRICSVEQFRAVLQKMEAEAQYDADGFISIGESIKLLVKSFRWVRGL